MLDDPLKYITKAPTDALPAFSPGWAPLPQFSSWEYFDLGGFGVIPALVACLIAKVDLFSLL